MCFINPPKLTLKKTSTDKFCFELIWIFLAQNLIKIVNANFDQIQFWGFSLKAAKNFSYRELLFHIYTY